MAFTHKRSSIVGCLILALAYLCTVHAEGSLVTIGGQSVRVVNDCTVGDDSTCPSGYCCVKEGLVYIPEATGPKPAYQIACKPYRRRGEFCYQPADGSTSTEFCPCEATLKCDGHSVFGHCQ